MKVSEFQQQLTDASGHFGKGYLKLCWHPFEQAESPLLLSCSSEEALQFPQRQPLRSENLGPAGPLCLTLYHPRFIYGDSECPACPVQQSRAVPVLQLEPVSLLPARVLLPSTTRCQRHPAATAPSDREAQCHAKWTQ